MTVQELVLNMIYPLPQPMANDEEWRRAHHEDLVELTVNQLRAEEARAELRLLLDSAPSEWLTERLCAVRGALDHAD
jgi:hypothetical protein